jgi:hypothetical protein
MRKTAIQLFILLYLSAPAQDILPAGYFRSPLDIPLNLSGSFGEPRTNHFHTGIDIRTNGTEGARVYAVADGYVSRVKISATGYGKAVYVTHPNGYVSVYGHLQRLNGPLAGWVKKEHYRLEAFEMDVYPEKDHITVRKGEVIAFSGNSGSSGGPHLHFEIRREDGQKPVNPHYLGISVPDDVRPSFTLLKIYPAGPGTEINGLSKELRVPVEGTGKEYRPGDGSTIRISGPVSFGVSVFDRHVTTGLKTGIYSLELFLDTIPVWSIRMDRLNFDHGRYVNSLLDYRELVKNRVKVQRTKVDPNNQLTMYGRVWGKGVVDFSDSLNHIMKYVAKDVAGNEAVLRFTVRSQPADPEEAEGGAMEEMPDFLYHQFNQFQDSGVMFSAPPMAFYDSFKFRYERCQPVKGAYSPVHQIHEETTAIHDYCSLSVRAESLPEGLRRKACLAKVTQNDKLEYAGGDCMDDGMVSGRIREFGRYCVAVDTVPPVINPIRPELFNNLKGQRGISFTISDDFSGIRSYKGTINGHWILMDYDAKNDLLTYEIDDRLPQGESLLRIEAADSKGNRKIYESRLFY